MLTDRDVPVLLALAQYFLLTRRLIQQLCYPADADGRITRRRMETLTADGFVRRLRHQVADPKDDPPAPAYCLDSKGRQFLAEHTGDERYLAKPVRVPNPAHLHHYLAVTATHILMDQAVKLDPEVRIRDWFNEHDVLNPAETDPAQHRYMFTELLVEPRTTVDPDAGFLLEYRGHRAVFYLEQDRARDNYSHRKVAERKTPGYSELLRQGRFREHFPQTTRDRFTVLSVSPTRHRRDALRRAFADQPDAGLWRFATIADLTPETVFTAGVWYSCTDAAARPLIRKTPDSLS